MKKYRKLIMKYLRENGLIAVVWACHSGMRFVVLKSDKPTNVYSAIFEEFWDKYDQDMAWQHHLDARFDYGKITWQACYRKLKEHGFVK